MMIHLSIIQEKKDKTKTEKRIGRPDLQVFLKSQKPR